MYKLLVILFILCLYARYNVFTDINEKHGQPEVKLTRLVKRYHLKLGKLKLHIKFLVTSKKT